MTTVNALRATRRARQALGCGLIGSAIFGSALAVAAPTKSKPAKQTAAQSAARGLLERGRSELNAGHPEQALSSFQAARQLDDSLQAAEGEADANLALGKPVAARAGYAAAVEQRSSSLTPAALAAADAKLDALRAAAAELQLTVPIDDVEIRVDGADVGRSPLAKPLLLDPGAHEFVLTKPGYVALNQELVLERGPRSETMTVTPEVATGKLQVSTSITPTTVTELLIDNRAVGVLPWEGTLPEGKVTLIARNDEATSRPLEITVTRDLTTAIVLTLEPNTGLLDVSAAAAGAEISVDGHIVGARYWHGSLPIGAHHVSVAREGYETQERDVRVQSNATTSEVLDHWVAAKSASTPPARNERGLYFRLDLTGTIANTSDGITSHCATAPSDAHCSSHAPLGGGLGLRMGYRFKWIAPEIWGLGSLNVSYVRAHYDNATDVNDSGFYGAARREDYVFLRYGWAAGVGVRATSPTRFIAATGGAGFGVFSEWGRYARTTVGSAQVSNAAGSVSVPAGQSTSSNASHSYAPGLLFDGGVLIGSSPGAKLYLGVALAIEFAPEHAGVAAVDKNFANAPYGTPALDVASGTQYRFGPVLGFQFGY